MVSIWIMHTSMLLKFPGLSDTTVFWAGCVDGGARYVPVGPFAAAGRFQGPVFAMRELMQLKSFYIIKKHSIEKCSSHDKDLFGA